MFYVYKFLPFDSKVQGIKVGHLLNIPVSAHLTRNHPYKTEKTAKKALGPYQGYIKQYGKKQPVFSQV
jgi:hypothetical protein